MKSMFNIKESPYGLLLFTAITLLVALVFPPIASIDLRDKLMFAVPLNIMIRVIPLLLISLWLLYLLTKRSLYSKTITWIHVLIAVSATILMMTVLYIGIDPFPYTDDRHVLIGNAMQVPAMLFIFGQLIYLANVLLGLFGRKI